MDLYSLLILGHVLGTALGVGGAIVAEAQVITAIKDGRIEDDERALMHDNYFLIRVGLVFIILSGIAIVFYQLSQGGDWVITSPKFLVKDIMVVVIIINAISLAKHWVSLSVGSAISMTSWLGAMTLGAWRSVPYSFLEIIVGYIVATAIIGFILHFIRKVFIKPR